MSAVKRNSSGLNLTGKPDRLPALRYSLNMRPKDPFLVIMAIAFVLLIGLQAWVVIYYGYIKNDQRIIQACRYSFMC